MASTHNELHEHFHHLKAVDLVPQEQHLVVLKSNLTLQEAVKALSDAHILAAPVKNAKTGQVMGMLSMLDIVTHIVLAAPNPKDLHDIKSLEIAGRALTLYTLENIIEKSTKDQLLPLPATVPSTYIIDLFSQGIHRCVLQKSETEEEIVKTHIGQLPLEKVGLGLVQPITVNEETSVLDALKTIAEQKIMAVAVVDKEGKLVGNFSASDLKGLYLEKLPNFEEPVKQYLTHFSPKSLNPVSLKATGLTLIDVVNHLVKGTDHVMHRVWLCNDENVVVGLVSLSDIMKLIVNFYE
ncbi:hypothetical protein ABK040_010856 [Willaertia magna]